MDQLSKRGDIYRVSKQRRKGIGFPIGTLLFCLEDDSINPFVITLDNVMKQYPKVKERSFIEEGYRKDLSFTIVEEMFIKNTISMTCVEKMMPKFCRGNSDRSWILYKEGK